jgi:hypothetical protein
LASLAYGELLDEVGRDGHEMMPVSRPDRTFDRKGFDQDVV